MTDEEVQAILTMARFDLIDFSIATNPKYEPVWFHEIIADKLMAVERGEIKRLMIFLPPRHGKSQLTSINFPAWYLGRNPEKEIITASYSGELAQDFGYKTRDLVSSQEYQAIFETRLKEDSKSKAKWLTDKNGSYTSVGVGGAVTGRGANIILIDDPLKNREEANSATIRNKIRSWFQSTAYTRLEKNGAIILIMTRWHLDDLAGIILEESEELWEVVDFPAIAIKNEKYRKIGDPLWKEKYDIEALTTIRQNIGVMEWSALYQQNPIPQENQAFKKEFFKYFEEDELKGKFFRYYITVDLAISEKNDADNTVILVVGKEPSTPNWYIIEKIVGKLTPLDLIDSLFSLYLKYRPVKIGIETVAYQKAILYFLMEEMKKRQVYLPIVELKTGSKKDDKELRICGLIPYFRTGVIFQRKSDFDMEEELLTFPVGKHDDIIDALAYIPQILETTNYHHNESMFEKKMREKNRKKQGNYFKMV